MGFSYFMKKNYVCSTIKRPGVRPDSTNTGETVRGNVKADWAATGEASSCVVALALLTGTLLTLILVCKIKIHNYFTIKVFSLFRVNQRAPYVSNCLILLYLAYFLF